MKSQRHALIIDIIKKNDIETQEELAEKLKEMGLNVTQATVSRDIRKLKLIKVPAAGNKLKYDIVTGAVISMTERQRRVFVEGVTSIQPAGNILVIKTLTGMAMAVAASIDAMDNKNIVGTIAGDDTIFCVLGSESQAIEAAERFRGILGEK